MTNKELADVLEKLAKHLRENQQDLPADMLQPVYDNLWPLYQGRPICEACRRGGVCGCYQPEWDSPRCAV